MKTLKFQTAHGQKLSLWIAPTLESIESAENLIALIKGQHDAIHAGRIDLLKTNMSAMEIEMTKQIVGLNHQLNLLANSKRELESEDHKIDTEIEDYDNRFMILDLWTYLLIGAIVYIFGFAVACLVGICRRWIAMVEAGQRL
jgi:hypothetical protein